MKILLTLAAVLVGLSIFTAEAKRPAHAGNPNHSISIVEATPAFGDIVTVVFETTEDDPWSYVECFQSGQLVMADYNLLNDTEADTIRLGPTPSWSSGGAECVLEIGRNPGSRFHVLASYELVVSP